MEEGERGINRPLYSREKKAPSVSPTGTEEQSSEDLVNKQESLLPLSQENPFKPLTVI